MAKAKKVKVWAVRYDLPEDTRNFGVEPFYLLKAHRKPCRRRNGEWSDTNAFPAGSTGFEALFPDCKLKPGGGPVRVR